MGFHEWMQKSAAKGLAKNFINYWRHQSNGSYSSLPEAKKGFVKYRKVYDSWWDSYNYDMHNLPEFLCIVMRQENKSLEDTDESIIKKALRDKLQSMGVDIMYLV